jgi:S-adenosylmethionine hydrolase
LAVHLTQPNYHLPRVSATFHGRDVFAPAAAHLASGVDPQEMGDLILVDQLVTLPALQPQPHSDGAWQAQVLHVDRFGNLVTTVQVADLKKLGAFENSELLVFAGSEQVVGLSRTFSDVEQGILVTYVGGSGYLEIALRDGSAAGRLGMGVGDSVLVEIR